MLGGTLSTVATAMLVGYGVARLGAAAFQELRNAIFANVQQSAIRNLALNVYRHLLDLDIRFHLSRETGGLTRAIDRGTKGISFILSSLVVHLFPTLLEIGMVSGILAYKFGPQYAVVTVATMATYIAFTLAITQWRTKFRRQMNVADNQAATVAVDSLINYESVKYFNAEEFQAKKYDKALANYQKAALKTADSLALLNAGQNAIFSTSLAIMMYMAAQGVVGGTMS
ncbi:Iron-sulfur clusters transporter atm1, mitochondrial, partial [Linderina pennispora]